MTTFSDQSSDTTLLGDGIKSPDLSLKSPDLSILSDGSKSPDLSLLSISSKSPDLSLMSISSKSPDLSILSDGIKSPDLSLLSISSKSPDLSLMSISSKSPDLSLLSNGNDHNDKYWDSLRAAEYGYLDEQDHVYLDYTGSGLASRTQLRCHAERLAGELCGNPHSQSPTSQTATKLVEDTRLRVLQHFHADPDEYMVIFTPNATGAAKLIGESYPFSPMRKLVLTHDNHNSVNGLRQYAKKRRCPTTYVPSRYPELTIDARKLKRALIPLKKLPGRRSSGLCAFPAQSNFSGVRQPLEVVAMAQAQGYDVLLDAAAFVPTSDLDLSTIKPEFVIMSWYKMFGFPTGVGCLIAKRSAVLRLKRPWFSGGTVEAVSVGLPWHKLTDDESAFEDGTVNFHAIPNILIGLDWVQKIGMSAIHQHVDHLAAYTLAELRSAKHSNGSPMVVMYGPETTQSRSGCFTFNILDSAGHIVDERIVGDEASKARISLRTGCFCNPGVGEDVFRLRVKTLSRLLWSKKPSIDEYIRLLKLPSAGAIRVSYGIGSTMGDVERLLRFIDVAFRDQVFTSEGLPPRTRC